MSILSQIPEKFDGPASWLGSPINEYPSDDKQELKSSKGQRMMVDIEVDRFIEAMDVLEKLQKEH